jgi:hypothetical protein
MMGFTTVSRGVTNLPSTMPSGPSSRHVPPAVTVVFLPLRAVPTTNFQVLLYISGSPGSTGTVSSTGTSTRIFLLSSAPFAAPVEMSIEKPSTPSTTKVDPDPILPFDIETSDRTRRSLVCSEKSMKALSPSPAS